MSDKLFVRRRILAFLMVFLLVFSAIILLPAFSVDAETEEEYAVASSGEISNEVALASGLSNIPPEYRNKCVEMTDSDEFEYAWNGKSTSSIKDYPGIYNSLYATAGNGPYVLNRDYSYSLADRNYDDPIGEIVPIELMQKIGVYTYFGKEYGFFINTYKSPHSIDKNIHSLVFVFDITYSMRRGQDGNPDGCVTVNVEPVFQYRYVYLDSNNSSFRMYDYYDSDDYANVFYSINKNVIRPHPKYSNGERSFDYQDIFYLKDVSVGMTLFNEQALNPNDKGYSYENDNGAFFIMAENEYSGRVLKDGKLTTDDKLDVASHVLGSVLDVVAFGANIIAPGSGTLIEILDVAGGLIDVADGARLWTNVSQSKDIKVECYAKKATFNCLYANKIEQINNYGGKTVKSMAVTNNSDNNNSIWYGQGDHYRAIFGINAEIASGQQFPNTRAFVECALKIVDKKGNVYGAQNAVNKTVDNETYQESIDFAESKNIYLLPNGYNCFSFVPYYSGKYIFNFDFNNSVKIEVDGEEINGNSVDIVKDYTPNAPPVKIKIKNNGDAVKGKLLIDVSSISQSIELNNTQKTIVKVDIDSGYYHLSTGNNNVVLVAKYSNKNGFGLEENFYSTSEIYTHLDNYTYIIIQNTIDTKANVSIHIDSLIQTIEENTSIKKQLTNMIPQYYRMVLKKNLSYILYYKEAENKSMIADVFDKYGKSLITSTRVEDNQCEHAFNVDDQEEVYIKFYKGDLANRNIDFIVTEADLIDWRINGESIKNRTIELPRMQKITVKAYINGKESSIVNLDTDKTDLSIGNIYYIKDTAPMGGNTIFKLQAGEYWNLVLSIKSVFEKNIRLLWMDNDGNLEYFGGNRIDGFTYRIEVSDGRLTKRSSILNVKCNYRESLYGQINLSSTIEEVIWKGGWEVPYVEVTIRIESITVLEHDEYDFDKDSFTTYTAKGNGLDIYSFYYYDFFDSGSGTRSDPYLVSSKKEFNSLGLFNRDFGKNLYFKQTVDLNFAKDEVPKTENKIFYGYLDGNKRSISISYEIKNGSLMYDVGGLFASNKGTICNYSNISYTVKSSLYYSISGIVDYNGGTISDIVANIYISNLGSSKRNETYNMGGIAAYNEGTIKGVTVNANIQSCSYYVGGIAGQNYGVIEQCNVKGTIDLYSEKAIFYAGSIAGQSNNKISNCSSAGSIISYKVGASDSRTLAPRIGSIVGVWAGGTMIATGSGSVNKGSLKIVTWWEGLKKQSHDQAGFVKTPYGQKTF
mgnify:CR=1 FL=1